MSAPFGSLIVFFVFLALFVVCHFACVFWFGRNVVRANAIVFSLIYALTAGISTFAFAVAMAAYTSLYVARGETDWKWKGLLPLTLAFAATRLLQDFDVYTTLFTSFIFIRCAGTVLWTVRFPRQPFAPADVFLSVMFFPTFAVGPIQLADRINGSLLQRLPTFDDVTGGFSRFLLGLAKTAWIAPTLLAHLDDVFWGYSRNLGPVAAILALWASLFYIYVMFSGYSDMAIGFCRWVGIECRENFDRPWKARTLQEFWQRWHMSLVWVTNNLIYQPIVRNTGRRYTGIIIAFTLIGVWHAFTWRYLVWGLLHGCGLAALAWCVRQPKVQAWWSQLSENRALYLAAQAIGWFITLTFVASLSYFAGGVGSTA